MEERNNLYEECAPSHDTQIKTTAFNSREEEHTDGTYEVPISSRDIEASSQREQANSTVQDENITLKNAHTTDSSRKQAASFTTRVMLIILAVAILLNTTMCVWLAISFQRAGLLSSDPSSSSTKSVKAYRMTVGTRDGNPIGLSGFESGRTELESDSGPK